MNREEAKSMLLDVLHSMELISKVERDAAAAPGADDIELGRLGIDSMAVVDICVEVEGKIGRELRVEEIIDNPTVDMLAAHLASPAP
ncbi:acyl carrier protein [Taklimakanibacter lacteus]|uniref:acyl carrier protein n=1 Tax=Taklimakanibacter lacteus TaxID=2268456 RepID=UPI000E673C86